LSTSSHLLLRPYSNIRKPVALPPGRAKLATKPVPTGSTTTTNTIGTVRVACSNGREGRSARTSQDCIRRKCGQFDRVLANVVGIGRGPAGVDPQVAAVGPPQRRQSLVKRPNAGLIFRIVRGRGHEDTDAPHPLGLLGARRERPRRRRAAECGQQFLPSLVTGPNSAAPGAGGARARYRLQRSAAWPAAA
jgi:hypothetical protein